MDDDDVPVTRDERPSGRRDPPRPNLDHADTEPAVVEPQTQPRPLDAGRRYEMGLEIARGGMGRVVEARDTMLGRVVALKAALDNNDDASRRFAREVRVTARLEHPAIVPVYDAGHTADGLPYYVMRKIGGRPLDKLVKAGRTLDDRLALLPHVLAAVDAVAHAHTRGILHRDLKPGNILIGEHGETVVIDWGLAKVIGTHPSLDPDVEDRPDAAIDDDDPLHTRAGIVVGTPGFIAPEQLRGDPATRCCDVYALGATLYHVLAGEPPHAARTSDEMITLALAGPPIPIADAADGVPHDLVTIVERAMAYDETRRYPDAVALGADLRRFLTGQLVASHRYSRVERVVRFVKRHRAAVGVTAIAMCVLGVLAYVSVTRIVRERNAADDAREVALEEKHAAEAARAREAERANDLLVSQAAALVATNPTAAVGLLHHLPPTATNWRKARDVLADARARGVPWVYPASAVTSGIVVGEAGTWVMSAGSDGVLRKHDTVDRSTTVLQRGTGNTRIALAAANIVVVADDTSIAWRLFETTRPPKPLARPLEHLAAGGLTAVFHDGRDLWQLGTSDPAPVKIPIDAGKVFGLAVSPDGKYVAVNAQPEALVIELGATPRTVVRRPARSMEPAWSADSKRLALGQVQGIDEIDFTAAPATRVISTIPNVQAAAYAGDDLYFTTGAQTAYRASAREGVVQINLPPAIYSSASSTQDAAVFVSTNGLIAVVGRGGAIAIRGPTSRMFRAIANRFSTKFVVSVHEYLLEYDTTTLLPRSLEAPLPNTTFHGFAGGAHYVIGYMLEDWRMFDLRDGSSRSLGRLEFGTFVAAAPDGSYVLAHGNRSRELFLLRPDRPPVSLGEASHAVAISPTVVVRAAKRAVAEVNLTTSIARVLWTPDGEIRGLDHEGPYVAAATATTLWRLDRRSGATSTVAVPVKPTAIDVASDGTVWIAAAHRVSRWNLDGSLVEIAQLTRAIGDLKHVTGIGCIAMDDRRTAYLIDDAKTVRTALPAGYELAFLADVAPLVAGLTHDRRLAIYDLETRHLWTLGAGESIADISRDGRYVATSSGGRVSIFTVELPRDREGYETWRDATTNLRVAEGRDELVWPRTAAGQ